MKQGFSDWIKSFSQLLITYGYYMLVLILSTKIVEIFIKPSEIVDENLVIEYYGGMINDSKAMGIAFVITILVIVISKIILKKPMGELIIKHEPSTKDKKSSKFWFLVTVGYVVYEYIMFKDVLL